MLSSDPKSPKYHLQHTAGTQNWAKKHWQAENDVYSVQFQYTDSSAKSSKETQIRAITTQTDREKDNKHKDNHVSRYIKDKDENNRPEKKTDKNNKTLQAEQYQLLVNLTQQMVSYIEPSSRLWKLFWKGQVLSRNTWQVIGSNIPIASTN